MKEFNFFAFGKTFVVKDMGSSELEGLLMYPKTFGNIRYSLATVISDVVAY